MNLITNVRRWRSARLPAPLQKGVAAVEFALTLPIWITLLLGAMDGSYCLIINERVDRIAYSVTDIVTQYKNITISNLNDITLAAGELMQPFSFGANGVVIVTSIYKPPGQNPTIRWQYTGGGSLVASSQIGTTGSSPVMPSGLVINDNDNVIVSEVFYKFDPLFLSAELFSAGTIYRTAVYKPRLSPLITPPV